MLVPSHPSTPHIRFLLRRLKEDVENKLPPKEETIIEVELTAMQKKYYRAIYEKQVHVLLEGAKAKHVPQLRNLCMELRKVCNHPFLCDGLEADYGEKKRKALKISHEKNALTAAEKGVAPPPPSWGGWQRQQQLLTAASPTYNFSTRIY